MRMLYAKYAAVNDLLKPDVKSLLDVGCRDAILKSIFGQQIKYIGVDIVPGPGVDHIANIEEGLPFADREFDAVVALDLLEHTNNIWFAFDELVRARDARSSSFCRTSIIGRRAVRFLLGREMGKYALPASPIVDRHRWLTSYISARRFCIERARCTASTPRSTSCLVGGRTISIDRLLSKVSNNLASLGRDVRSRKAVMTSAPPHHA